MGREHWLWAWTTWLLVGTLGCGSASLRGATAENDASRLRGTVVRSYTVERCLAANGHPVWIEAETVELVHQNGKALLIGRRADLLPLRITNGTRAGSGYQYSVVFESETGDGVLAQYHIPKNGDGTLVLASDWEEQERPSGFDARPIQVSAQCELVLQ